MRTFALQRSDIVVYELDRPALDTALAAVFGLIEETDAGTDLPGTTRIGVYSIRRYRFPVYLTIQIRPDDFQRGARRSPRPKQAFLLLALTRGFCTAKAEKRLTDKRSGMVSLSENVGIEAKRQFQLFIPWTTFWPNSAGSIFRRRRKAVPLPPHTSRRVVGRRRSARDGHTVSIKAKTAGGVFNYTQMGMANKKNGNPTVQWELLKVFADERGVLDWSSNKAHRRNQKRRELLAANLRDFFRIEGDPFRLTDDGKGWQALFLISPDE